MLLTAIPLILFSAMALTLPTQANPFQQLLETKAPRVDLDFDGKPDVFREYKSGKLTRLTYQPSRERGYRDVYTYGDRTYTREVFVGGALSSKTIESAGSQESFSQYRAGRPQLRTLKTHGENEIKVETFRAQGEKWILASTAREPRVMHSWKEDLSRCKNFFIPERLWKGDQNPACGQYGELQEALSHYINHRCVDSAKDILRFENGFAIDQKSCNLEDYDAIWEALNLMIKTKLPCLQSLNPKKAFEFAAIVQSRTFTISCNVGLKCGGPEGCVPAAGVLNVAATTNSNGNWVGWLGATISLVQSSPRSQLTRQRSPEMRREELASTLFHEVFHHISDDGEHHSSKTAEQFDDAVYGCEHMCENVGTEGYRVSGRLSIKGCQKCIHGQNSTATAIPPECTAESPNRAMKYAHLAKACLEAGGEKATCDSPRILDSLAGRSRDEIKKLSAIPYFNSCAQSLESAAACDSEVKVRAYLKQGHVETCEATRKAHASRGVSIEGDCASIDFGMKPHVAGFTSCLSRTRSVSACATEEKIQGR